MDLGTQGLGQDNGLGQGGEGSAPLMPAPPMQGQATAKSSRKSNPSLDQVTSWANADVGYWTTRDERMQSDQSRWEMVKDKVPEGEELVLFNDPRVLVDKVAGMFSKHKFAIHVPNRIPELKEVSQHIKDALMYWERESEINHASALRGPMKYDEAQFVALRGWIAGRVMYNPYYEPDPTQYDFPVFCEVIDPANVYPKVMGKVIGRVTHRYKATIDDLLNDPALVDAGKAYKNETDTGREVDVTAVYAFNAKWDFHAVYANGAWLKKPTAIGYLPWIIVVAGGAAYRGTKWDTAHNFIPQMGVSVFESVKGQMDDLNDMASMMKTLLAAEANPAVAYTGSDPNVLSKVSLKAGARFVIDKEGKVQPVTSGPDPTRYHLLLDQVSEHIQKGSIPDPAFGAGRQESELRVNSIMNAVDDMIGPYLQALETFRKLKFRKGLELFATLSPYDTKIFVPTQATTEDPFGSWTSLTAGDVMNQGFQVDVKYAKLTYQDKAALMQAIIPAVQADILSREEVRGHDWLFVDNPGLEDMRITAEKVHLNPDFIKQMIPMALAKTGEELMYKAYTLFMQQQEAMGQVPGQSGGANDQGSQPGMTTLPGQALQPGAAGNPTAPTDIASLIGQRMGNLGGMPGLGGSGFGGTPPMTPEGGNPTAV